MQIRFEEKATPLNFRRVYVHDPLPLFPFYLGITETFSMWGIFFRRTDKALPVRSLLAATSHAAQGGSPAGYSIFPSALLPRHCGETPTCEWRRQQGRWRTNKYLSTHTHTHTNICASAHTDSGTHVWLWSTAAWYPTSTEYQWAVQVHTKITFKSTWDYKAAETNIVLRDPFQNANITSHWTVSIGILLSFNN